MIRQGFEFYINDEIEYKVLENNKQYLKIEYQTDNLFFYNSEIEETNFYINSVCFTKDNDDLLNLKHPVVNLDINIKECYIEIFIENLQFNLEKQDHIKIMFHFDIDEREGIINLLIN
jgi:hypothetical protein